MNSIYCVRHCSKDFTRIYSFKSHNNNEVGIILILQRDKWESPSTPSKVTVGTGEEGWVPGPCLSRIHAATTVLHHVHGNQLITSSKEPQYSQCAHSTDRKIKALGTGGWGLHWAVLNLPSSANCSIRPNLAHGLRNSRKSHSQWEITLITFLNCFPFQRSTKLISSFSSSWVFWIQTPISVHSFSRWFWDISWNDAKHTTLLWAHLDGTNPNVKCYELGEDG